MNRLLIIRGPAGSGKSTLARLEDGYKVEGDDFFTTIDGIYLYDQKFVKDKAMWMMGKASKILYNGESVIVTTAAPSLKSLKKWQSLAQRHHAKFQVVDMINQFGNVHNVPEDVLKSMVDTFELYKGPGRIVKEDGDHIHWHAY